MYRSEDEKLIDTLMGEAVITLLKSQKTISMQRLLAQLELMATGAGEGKRKDSCEQLINEIRSGLNQRKPQTTYEIRSTDNVRHFFNAEGPPDDRKKH